MLMTSKSASVSAAAMNVRSKITSAISSFVPGFYSTLNDDDTFSSTSSSAAINTLALSTSGDQLLMAVS